ncbi:hypothetical protein BDZ45DRAFT_185270 [Acephala macrosclerotiorum]|nr:hypothetical protein BDZ45DRAFT_185270 [Acephala macrosclerotiorum]
MPNTSKLSLASHLCGKRRVHCDLTQSGCLWCAKIGKTCPGYRQEQDLLFRNEDKQSFTSKGRDGRRNKRVSCSSGLETGSKDFLLSPSGKGPSRIIFSKQTQSTAFLLRRQRSFPQPTEQWHTYCVPIVLN